MLNLRTILCLTALALMAAAQHARSQNFPAKPVRMLTNEVGGGGDVLLRLMQSALTAELGQPIVIDNRPLIVAGEIVAKAPADGYTTAVYGTTLWIGPLMQPVPYDPLRDFAAVTMMSKAPAVVLIHPSVAANSTRELIALARAKPGVLNYSSGNSGGLSHLAMELMKSMAGVDIVRISYKGAGPALNALIAGEVQIMLATVTGIMSHVKAGRARALAVTTAQRSALVPELPSVSESGLPGYDAASIIGMVTTAKTPATAVNRLNQTLVKVMNRPDMRDKILATGGEAATSSPQEFGATIKSEMIRMGKVIREAGIRTE